MITAWAALFISPFSLFSQCQGFAVQGIPGLYAGGFLATCEQSGTYIKPYNISCYGKSDGFIDLKIEGGESPFTFQWSDGSRAQNLNHLGPGNYSVQVKDANGCAATWNGEITQPAPISAKIVAIPVSGTINGGDCHLLEAREVYGGTAFYFFDWSDGDQNSARQICQDKPDNLFLSIRDINGCKEVFKLDYPLTQATAGEPILFTAFPNPFDDVVSIRFQFHQDEKATLSVYQTDGKWVGTIWEGIAEAGLMNELTYNGKDLSQGVYELHLKSESGEVRRLKIMLVR